jgi:hypothetical protein
VSAPAGTFGSAPGAVYGATVAATSAFVLQCNPDPAIPTDGSGCNLAGLASGTVRDDGSLAPTNVVIVTGVLGSDPRSTCPPTQAQATAGVVNCMIAAAPGGDQTRAATAAFTIAGQTVTLPVDGTGTPTPPTTPPTTHTTTPPPGGGGGGGGGGADVLGTSTVAPTSAAPTSAAAAVTPTGTLPYTGLGGNIWFIAGVAILLVDIGAVSSSYAKRRAVG